MTEASPPRPPARSDSPPRPRGGEARAVADLVPEVGRAAFRRFGFVQASVVTRWPEIVGERFSRVTAPRAIRFPVGAKTGGTLDIRVEGSNATVIQHILPEIVERVNRFFGYAAVARIALSQGKMPERRGVSADRPPPAAAGMALGSSLRSVGDPELATLLGALGRQLAGDGPEPPAVAGTSDAFSPASASAGKRMSHEDFF